MNKINTSSLEQFLDRVRQSQRSRAKQLVLSIEEANDIAASLAQILLEKTKLLSEINELQKASEVVEVTIGGGSFKD